ncbi:sulfite exporter TauE/SafE family protein [Massilia sp. CFBP9012]|uniref:sulfite exporter TauE/SafE family protein n=1 Tax=Massilia sp. CFBP9012 TaxID=3096531 RepID=UPI002A6A06EB|nr:sulfite exporter TauE/SafE family protein [Massilia sp. CFBP9012]MDY0976003.1 sulfite exporter TauE/SafE family protein [Massilia sp. CFBP9012]
MNESTFLLASLAATFPAAGLVKGVTGMGLPTVAMGLLGMAMTPAAAAALLVLPSFVTNVLQMTAGPGVLRLVTRLWPMLLGTVVGTAGGVVLLARVDPQTASLALGLTLILYAGYALAAPSLVLPRRHEVWLGPVVGVATGLVTGATGVFVVPAVPYLQALRLDKDELVQALGLSFTVSTVALAIGLATHGAFAFEQLGLSALAIAPALLGMWLGQAIRARISAKRFRQCFLAFLIGLGLELASRSLA